jgi:hypothetical protein
VKVSGLSIVGIDKDAEAALPDLLLERSGRLNEPRLLLSELDLTKTSVFRVWISKRLPGVLKLCEVWGLLDETSG